MFNYISEFKFDLSNEDESKETCMSHSDQIKAKLNKWKSSSSNVVINTMDTFLKKKIEPIKYNNQNINEEAEENNVSTIEIVKTKENKKKTNVELEQDSVKDEGKKTPTFINNSDSDDIELTFVGHSNDKKYDIEDQEYNLENITEKSDDMENLKMCSKSEGKTMYNIKLNCGLSKIETDIIEIDTSEAPKNRKCVIVETSVEQIKQKLKTLSSQTSVKQKMKTRFYATIDPSKNQQAESELSREISKDTFSQVNKNYFRLIKTRNIIVSDVCNFFCL